MSTSKTTPDTKALVDSFGRIHTSLRISVTDRCNIRCFYCMPNENVEFMPRPEILTFEEIEAITKVFVSLGINKLRMTGGEPLVRKDLPALVARLAAIEGIKEVAMTTNAILLDKFAKDLREAGLDRLNVSLDSVDRDAFREMTRRDSLQQVLAGISAAKQAGFENIRLNAVAIAGLSESQIVPLAKYAFSEGLHLRFIEFMPLNAAGRWEAVDVLSGAKVRKILEAEFGPLVAVGRPDSSQPAAEYEVVDVGAMVGFINSVTEPFCEECNRVRLTADGKMRNCLFASSETDLREPLRSGATDDELRDLIRACVAAKKKSHGIGEPEFMKPKRAMNQIGG